MVVYSIVAGLILLVGFCGNLEYLVFGIFFSIPAVLYWRKEFIFNNYVPPKGTTIDHGKINKDIANGVSIDDVKTKKIRGEYNEFK